MSMFYCFSYQRLLTGGHLATLPDDIKREILEIVAYIRPRDAVRLTWVSREVQRWIEQIIYRTVYFNGNQRLKDGALSTLERFRRTIDSRPASFFAEHVKTLHFDRSLTPADILPVLRVCTGVTNFGCYMRLDMSGHIGYEKPVSWGNDEPDSTTDESDDTRQPHNPVITASTELYGHIHALPLERLFISTANLTSLLSTPPPASTTPSKSSLATLTHLALTDDCLFPLARFPSLTHLALLSPDHSEGSASKKTAPLRKEETLTLIRAALTKPQTRSIVNMLSDTRVRMPRTLWDLGDARFVNFTMPMSETKFVEDDLWDLAMEFPDEEEPERYLEQIEFPRILTFEEYIQGGY